MSKASEEHDLRSSIQFIKGVGPNLARVLAKKGVTTIEDALYNLPRTYQDRSRLTPIANLRPFIPATILAKVVAQKTVRKGRRRSFEVTVSDETGDLRLFWFNLFPSLQKEFEVDTQVLLYGTIKYFQGGAQMVHPEYEKVSSTHEGKPVPSVHFGRIVPVYSETEGLKQKTIRRIMGEVLKTSFPQIEDSLPEPMRQRLELPDLKDSFLHTHFPKRLPEDQSLSPALRRIVFEEFFILQLGLGLKKQRKKKQKSLSFSKMELADQFLQGLPFSLTEDQKKALSEINEDLAKDVPMTRLVQGDVGSGKTVVALAASAVAAADNAQTALMVPTEVLAQQHYKTVRNWLEPKGISCELLAQGSPAEVARKITSGETRFVVGTHALFQKKIKFKKLGLVIVDEQHRFGVDQRNELLKKGGDFVPHLLMMSATPIPRTLAFTLYGDLDFSIIREKPIGRKPIKTRILREKDRPSLYNKIRSTVKSGQQAYIIYPLVEESEKLELKSATEMYTRLSQEIFPDLKLALLHGRMKPEEKDDILRAFGRGEYQLLVSTTVIEVGIDVPNATLMIIEHPERLGLSQLHQLRGRVGRGELVSECILMADKYVTERLKVMVATEDGFVIAEEDLKLRGPGEFLGTRQSGLPGFRVGHIVRDASLLQLARKEATEILSKDPDLKLPKHKAIKGMVEDRWKEKISRLRSG